VSLTASFVLHPAAKDIAEIWDFIAADNVAAAEQVRQEILDAIRRLARFPLTGHTRTDITARPLRFQLVREYLIAYAPEKKPLLVVSVIHGRRYPRLIAGVLRDRE
jgi:toxin ParE1/3/4